MRSCETMARLRSDAPLFRKSTFSGVDLSPIYRKLLFAIYLIQINSITYNFIFFYIYEISGRPLG